MADESLSLFNQQEREEEELRGIEETGGEDEDRRDTTSCRAFVEEIVSSLFRETFKRRLMVWLDGSCGKSMVGEFVQLAVETLYSGRFSFRLCEVDVLDGSRDLNFSSHSFAPFLTG